MKCDICKYEFIENDVFYEMRGDLGNKHSANLCQKCFKKYKSVPIKDIEKMIK